MSHKRKSPSMSSFAIWLSPLVLWIVVEETHAFRTESGINVVEGSFLPNPVAISVTSFTDLIEHGNIFIDKTKMISNIVELWMGKMKIMARPSGWGKSVILDMIRFFFEVEVDQKGGYIALGQISRSYKLFQLGVYITDAGQARNLRDPLFISKHEDVLKEHRGQYIVLHVSFAGYKPKTLEEFENEAGSRIRNALQKYNFHRRHEILLLQDNEEDKRVLEFLDVKTKVRGFSWEVLRCLSKLIEKFIKLKPIILIDDYDEPMIEVLNDETLPNKMELVESMVNSYNSLINLLRNGTFYTFALLTGTMKMEIPNEIPDTYFFQYYGFDYNETDLLFDYLDVSTELRKKAIAHYCGYEYAYGEPNLCNSLHIAKFLANLELRNYWDTNAPIHGVVRKCFRCAHFRKTVQRMLTGYKRYEFRLLTFVNTMDFGNLSKFLEAPYFHSSHYDSIDVHHYDSMGIRVSHAAGYFTNTMVNQFSVIEPYYYTEQIPNEGARRLLQKYLWLYYSSELGIVGKNPLIHSISDKFRQFLMEDGNATEELKTTFKNFLHTLPRFQQTSIERDNVTVRAILAYNILNLIAVYMDYFELQSSNEDEEFGSNILLKRETRGTFVQMTIGRDSAELALNETGEYIYHMFRNHPAKYFEWIKRVGMNYCPNGTMQIESVMMNVPRGDVFNLTQKYAEARYERMAAIFEAQTVSPKSNKTKVSKSPGGKKSKKSSQVKKKLRQKAAEMEAEDVVDVEPKTEN